MPVEQRYPGIVPLNDVLPFPDSCRMNQIFDQVTMTACALEGILDSLETGERADKAEDARKL